MADFRLFKTSICQYNSELRLCVAFKVFESLAAHGYVMANGRISVLTAHKNTFETVHPRYPA